MNVLKIRAELRNGRSLFDLPLRVTFYARVSTEKDEQLNSLENQIQYYTELIRSKPSWTYIPGYIDEGISGTSTRKRDSFLRMVRDALILSSQRRSPAFLAPPSTASNTLRSCSNMA